MPPTSHEQPPLRSRIFDYAVVAVGVAMALAATGIAVSAPDAPGWGYWLAVPVIALVERYPLSLFARTASVQVSFSSCLVGFLSMLLDVSAGMMIWSAGVVLAQAVSRVRWSARVFNLGVGLTAGGIGFAVIDWVRGSTREVSPHELAAIAVGCAAMFLVDYLLSEVSVAFEEGSAVATELVTRDMAVALGGVVTIDSVGYLGAIVQRELPQWCLGLLAVPIAALIIASNSRDVALESGRRLRIMFASAARMQGAETREDVLQHVRRALHQLARGTRAHLQAEPPQPGQIGEPLDDGNQRHWLVTEGLWRAHPDPALDSQHLGSLARMATEALTRVRMGEVVSRLAESDPLTGLCNRSVFLQRIDDALRECRTSESGCEVAVLFCDLDGFKRVNDWFGHAAGDELLIDVARSLEENLGPDALVARLGGDEFAVLLRRLPSAVLTDRTRTVLAAVERRFEYDGRSVLVSTSVGAALSNGRHTADQLLRNADLAMYAAKFDGKNRARTYHPAIGRARVQTLELAEALGEALARREVTVAYQPIVNVESGRIVGVEALARWRHEGRDIPADTFVALAEEHGLIEDLGELVLDIVGGDAVALAAASDNEIAIGVNVSALQLHSPRLVAAVRRVRGSMGPASLVLELTERQVIGDDASVLHALNALESDDVFLALDDFGVGFSSIGYLQRLAVRILKIDRQFSADIDTDPRAMRLLLSMVDMGRAMDLDIVIEGVEHAEQLAALLPSLDGFAEHVYLQGFLLGRPMALHETLEHIERSAAPVNVLTS